MDDFIVSSTGANSEGRYYVFYGKKEGLPKIIQAEEYLKDRLNGFTIEGIDSKDALTLFSPPQWFAAFLKYVRVDSTNIVNRLGDIDGDGINDIFIGAPGANNQAGEAYIIYGRNSSTFPKIFKLENLNGRNGFTIHGINDKYANAKKVDISVTAENTPTNLTNYAYGDALGFSGGWIGDINGDGIDDIGLGAPTAKPQAHALCKDFPKNIYNYIPLGEAYVLYGKKDKEFKS